MIYTEEKIYISGELYEDEAMTIPISLMDKTLRFDFIKEQTTISFTIMDNEITKVDNTYNFIIGDEITSKYSGKYTIQVSIIENGDVVKSVVLDAITINRSKDVLND